jgi:hypothetical protein
VKPAGGRHDLSTWGSVRRWEAATREQLRRRYWLGLHGWCIGIVVLAFMWAAAHLQMVMGSDSLALRYLITLGAGYLGFLLVLRWWAGALVEERQPLPDAPGDIVGNLATPRGSLDITPDVVSPLRAGGGGDFGGGGAEGGFDVLADAGERLGEAVGDGVGEGIGEVAGGALEVAGSVDEGAVVVIPVVAVFLIGCLVLFGAGSLLLLYFGSEVLMAVAVEVAFGYVSARTAVRVAREGWLNAAVRLTWKPLAGALACAVLLGGLIDYFVPQARSLPHAVQILRQGH